MGNIGTSQNKGVDIPTGSPLFEDRRRQRMKVQLRKEKLGLVDISGGEKNTEYAGYTNFTLCCRERNGRSSSSVNHNALKIYDVFKRKNIKECTTVSKCDEFPECDCFVNYSYL